MGNTFWLIISILCLIWVAWFFTNGQERSEQQHIPFSQQDGVATSSNWNNIFSKFQIFKGVPTIETPISLFADTVGITSAEGARSADPNREYIELGAYAGNKNTVSVSGWSLKSSDGRKIIIDGASPLPKSGAINQEVPIALPPGGRIIVTTGRSPIGVSFRENICSGYFEQFQDFYPPLSLSCPSASIDLAQRGLTGDSSCVSFAAGIPSCVTQLSGFPGNLSSSCMSYVQSDLTQNGCISFHQDNSFFYKNMWRVFVGENTEIWSNGGGIIRLYDNEDKLVDSFVY